MANLNDLVQAVGEATVREAVFQHHYTRGRYQCFQTEDDARFQFEMELQHQQTRDVLLGTYLPVYEAQVQAQQQNVQRQANAQVNTRRIKTGVGATLAAICLGSAITAKQPGKFFGSFIVGGVAAAYALVQANPRRRENE